MFIGYNKDIITIKINDRMKTERSTRVAADGIVKNRELFARTPMMCVEIGPQRQRFMIPRVSDPRVEERISRSFEINVEMEVQRCFMSWIDERGTKREIEVGGSPILTEIRVSNNEGESTHNTETNPIIIHPLALVFEFQSNFVKKWNVLVVGDQSHTLMKRCASVMGLKMDDEVES